MIPTRQARRFPGRDPFYVARDVKLGDEESALPLPPVIRVVAAVTVTLIESAASVVTGFGERSRTAFYPFLDVVEPENIILCAPGGALGKHKSERPNLELRS
jgi:hypothetical protein